MDGKLIPDIMTQYQSQLNPIPIIIRFLDHPMTHNGNNSNYVKAD